MLDKTNFIRFDNNHKRINAILTKKLNVEFGEVLLYSDIIDFSHVGG